MLNSIFLLICIPKLHCHFLFVSAMSLKIEGNRSGPSVVGFLFQKTGFTLLELSNSQIRLSCYCIKVVLIYASHKYLHLEILSCIGSEAGKVSIFHRQEN